MSKLDDIVRSFVRAAADTAKTRLRETLPIESVRRIALQLKQRQTTIGYDELTAVIAHAGAVTSASASYRAQSMMIHAELADGTELSFGLRVGPVRFAPRGAKEVSFMVEPQVLPAKGHAVVSAVAGAIAKATWPMLISFHDPAVSGAFVDADGPGRFRVDLRSVPALRRAAQKDAAKMIMDVIEIETLQITPQGLCVRFKLPPLFG